MHDRAANGFRIANRLVPRRVQTFLEEEASSGIVLLSAALVALVCVNSPWRTAYDATWSNELSARLGPLSVGNVLRHWVCRRADRRRASAQPVPSYVHDSPTLAHVLEDGTFEQPYEQLGARTFDHVMIAGSNELRCAEADDRLVVVAWVMVRSRTSLVGVVERGRLIGGISVHQLIEHFRGRR